MWQEYGNFNVRRQSSTLLGYSRENITTVIAGNNMSRHIVLVEDEPGIRENYVDALRKQNYEVTSYENKHDAMLAFKSGLPDLVLLDIGLGDDAEAGFDMCRELRHLSLTLPIIFLTARDSDIDAISGLRLGADDYITKDINIHQLLARIAALFRRVDAIKESGKEDRRIKHNDLMMDVDCLLIEWKGQRIELTLTEFWIVHSLARIPGHVKNREQLMSEANIFVDDSTVTSHMKTNFFFLNSRISAASITSFCALAERSLMGMSCLIISLNCSFFSGISLNSFNHEITAYI